MQTLNEEWITIMHPDIKPNEYEISSYGRIRDIRGTHEPEYHSTNGYDYTLMTLKDNKGVRLFPVDMLVASAFLSSNDIDNGKPLKVIHLNGDLRNNEVTNLEFVEDIEEWKTIEYPGVRENTYQISNWGRVRRIIDGLILKDQSDGRGYRMLELTTNKPNTGILFKVHRLVAYAFVNLENNDIRKLQVNHIDGVKYNNHWNNLEWVTPSGNIRHSIQTGLQPIYYGEDSPCAKLSNNDVENICALLKQVDGDVDAVMKRVSITDINCDDIKAIKYGQNWKHISSKYFTPKEFINRLDNYELKLICESLKKNDGDIRKVQNELHGIIPDKKLKYKRLQGIRLCKTGINVSEKYFSKEDFLNKGQRYEHPKGEKVALSVIDDRTAHKICQSLINNWGDSSWVYRELSPDNGLITLRMISHIKNKECWSHISDLYFTKDYISQLKTRKIEVICETLTESEFNVDIAYCKLKRKMKYLTKRYVSDIKKGYTHRDISKKYF